MSDTPPASPSRPDLTATVSKPDILVRLRWWIKELPPEYVGLREDIANAVSVIEGLRETCDRRLAMIEDLKRELTDRKHLLQRVTLDSEWSCMAADLQSDIEATLAGSRPIEGR